MVLYLVATPIGNLGDITLRALEVLRACDLILCEDTRHSKVLLDHYQINCPLKSYHRFNESRSEDGVIASLREGQKIALISDAGTPGISDPGERLIARCIAENIPVSALPGPCALIAALTLSGLATERFQFVGFLPRQAQALKQALLDVLSYPGTTVCYESPHRLLDVLALLADLAPQRALVVGRELTKKFEEMRRGCAKELLLSWQESAPRGECVLLIAGDTEPAGDFEELSPEEHVRLVQEQYRLSPNEAIKLVAKLRGLPKRSLYDQIKKNDQIKKKV